MVPNNLNSLKAKLVPPDLSRPALFGIAAVIVMVAVFAGVSIFDAATANTYVVGASDKADSYAGSSPSGSAASGGAVSGNAAGTGSATANDADGSSASSVQDGASGQTEIYAHVAGCVNEPGIVKLKGEARVADAVEAAGGFSDEALQESVNLARAVSDGEQVIVLSREAAEQGQAVPAGQTAMGTQPDSPGQAASQSGKVNLNTASEEELQTLNGIGPALAKRIVLDRESNGPFSSVEDLKRVSGIGDKKFQSLSGSVCV